MSKSNDDNDLSNGGRGFTVGGHEVTATRSRSNPTIVVNNGDSLEGGHEVQLPVRPPSPPVVRTVRIDARPAAQLPVGLRAVETRTPQTMASKGWTVATAPDRSRIPEMPMHLLGPGVVIIEAIPPYMVEAVCIRSDREARLSSWKIRLGPRRTREAWLKLFEGRLDGVESALARLCNKASAPHVESRVGAAFCCVKRGDAEPQMEVITWFLRNPAPKPFRWAKLSSWFPAVVGRITRWLSPPPDSWADHAPFIDGIVRPEFGRAATGLWAQTFGGDEELEEALRQMDVAVAQTVGVNKEADLELMIAESEQKIRGFPRGLMS